MMVLMMMIMMMLLMLSLVTMIHAATHWGVGCSTLQYRRRLEIGESEAFPQEPSQVGECLPASARIDGEAFCCCNLSSDPVSDPACSRVCCLIQISAAQV